MQIIRILWGKQLEIVLEVPKVPLFDNELVYVWGSFNNEYLISLGYKTFLIDENITYPKFSTHLTHFGHKIYALQLAEESFDEYLFLDWDVKFIKPIDDVFYSTIRNGNNIQCPLYAYSIYFKESYNNFIDHTDGTKTFVNAQEDNLSKHSWRYEDTMVIPCTCFFYSRNTKIMKKLLGIIDKFRLQSVVDELSFFIFINCTMDEYISKYEPVVIRGKEKDRKLETMSTSINKINRYIDKKIDKNIYLIHDD